MFLTAVQINDLLTRNGNLRTLVDEFNAENFFLTWQQGGGSNDFLSWLTSLSVPSPIPSDGVWLNDASYGPVIVVPNANGILIYNQVDPTSQGLVSAQEIPASGDGLPQIPTVTQLTTALGAGLTSAEPVLLPVVLGLGALYLLSRKI